MKLWPSLTCLLIWPLIPSVTWLTDVTCRRIQRPPVDLGAIQENTFHTLRNISLMCVEEWGRCICLKWSWDVNLLQLTRSIKRPLMGTNWVYRHYDSHFTANSTFNNKTTNWAIECSGFNSGLSGNTPPYLCCYQNYSHVMKYEIEGQPNTCEGESVFVLPRELPRIATTGLPWILAWAGWLILIMFCEYGLAKTYTRISRHS